jgi:hypothetical protein
MADAVKATRSFSRQLLSGAARVWRQLPLELQHMPWRAGAAVVTTTRAMAGATKFGLARQSSLDQTPAEAAVSPLAMPENLDATIRLLYAACQGDTAGVENLLMQGLDVDIIDFDGRTALAAHCRLRGPTGGGAPAASIEGACCFAGRWHGSWGCQIWW